MGNGALSKAFALLLSDGVQDGSDPKVLARLQGLHPAEPEPMLPQWDAPQLEFPNDEESKRERLIELRKLIFSFPKESAAGPSGLRPDHLKILVGEMPGDSGEGLLLEIDRFVRECLTRPMAAECAEIICSARLTPLRKVKEQEEISDPFGNLIRVIEGCEDTRPIAAGETLRRLAGKVLMRHHTVKQAIQELHPPQVGGGVPSACPMVAMGVQQLVK